MITQIKSTAIIAAGILWGAATWWVAGYLQPSRVVPLPFGDVRLALVQFAAIAPVAWFAANAFAPKPRYGILAMLVSCVAAVATPWWTPKIFEILVSALEPGIFEHREACTLLLHALRFLAGFVSMVGFCFAARSMNDVGPSPKTTSALLLCLAVAVLPTVTFAHSLAIRFHEQAESFGRENREWRAWQKWKAAESIVRMRDSRQGQNLGAHVEVAAQRAVAFEANGTTSDRVWAAYYLLELDEHAHARRILERLPTDATTASDQASHRDVDLLPSEDYLPPGMITMRQDFSEVTIAASDLMLELNRREHRWHDVIPEIENRIEDRNHSANAQEIDLLAAAYREIGNGDAAERLYRRTLTSDPVNSAYWHLQLGKHYKLAGRTREAMIEWTAAHKDPRYRKEVDVLIRQLRMTTPTCVPW